MPRMPSPLIRRPSAGLFLIAALVGCLKPTAPPATPSAPAAVGPPAAAPAPARSEEEALEAAAVAAREAANARIAGLPRVDLLGKPWTGALTPQGEVRKVEVTALPAAGQPFSDAVRIAIKEGSGSPWGVQLQGPIAAPVAKGDAVLATFYLRTETPQEGSVGETEFVFELARAPYNKAASYPVQAGPSWSKVQVRFLADRAYAAGEAQMIFRLGYEPETIDIGGVKVESFGKIALGDLPTTMGSDRRRERAAAAALKAAEVQATEIEGGELRFEVAPAVVVRTISPYVYGINSQKPEDSGTTLRRMGGNRQSAYNWELNASNAGSDYHHSSDGWPCTALGFPDCKTQPGAQFLDFAAANRADGLASMVTIPLIDYVAADMSGAVPEKDKAPSKRWARSYPKKPAAFVTSPDLGDGAVYEDELVNLLVGKLGRAGQGGIKFYSLDNEPALWPETHPRVHPDKTTYAEMVSRTEATAAEITRLDPDAMVLGGVMFGWSEFMSLSSAPDAKEQNAKYGSYVDYLLAQMKRLEQKHHRRLVHVLDVHWYPEARGTKRITEKDVSGKTVTARLQATRSLWDPTYTEKSWITAEWGKPIRLIPWLEERIAARYPGTKLGMTEYNFGAGDHISGGLAQADALGIFGREGLALANYWGDGPGNGELPKFIKSAFKLYRNYDGKQGTFGDTAVAATADLDKSSIYAATDSKRPDLLTVLVINKELRTNFDGRIQLKDAAFRRAEVYRLDGSSPDIRPERAIDLKNGQIAARLPPLSATLFVCRK
jgi:mannan endo-1,4-beta-mannosidase